MKWCRSTNSMSAKLIVFTPPTRPSAIEKMTAALEGLRIEGIKTTVPLLRALISRDEFARVAHYSTFVEDADIPMEEQ